MTNLNPTLLNRRYADMKRAAVAYAIVRIGDFTNNGADLTPTERDHLRRLADNAEVAE